MSRSISDGVMRLHFPPFSLFFCVAHLCSCTPATTEGVSALAHHCAQTHTVVSGRFYAIKHQLTAINVCIQCCTIKKTPYLHHPEPAINRNIKKTIHMSHISYEIGQSDNLDSPNLPSFPLQRDNSRLLY